MKWGGGIKFNSLEEWLCTLHGHNRSNREGYDTHLIFLCFSEPTLMLDKNLWGYLGHHSSHPHFPTEEKATTNAPNTAICPLKEGTTLFPSGLSSSSQPRAWGEKLWLVPTDCLCTFFMPIRHSWPLCSLPAEWAGNSRHQFSLPPFIATTIFSGHTFFPNDPLPATHYSHTS